MPAAARVSLPAALPTEPKCRYVCSGLALWARATRLSVQRRTVRMRPFDFWQYARVPGFSGLTVKEPAGERWELALVLLKSGEAAVSLDGVILNRDVHGPRATGRIRIDIPASCTPLFLTSTVAEKDVARALSVIEAASNADPRFARILADLGSDRAYVDDNSIGSVALAEVTADGLMTWHTEWKPQDAH